MASSRERWRSQGEGPGMSKDNFALEFRLRPSVAVPHVVLVRASSPRKNCSCFSSALERSRSFPSASPLVQPIFSARLRRDEARSTSRVCVGSPSRRTTRPTRWLTRIRVSKLSASSSSVRSRASFNARLRPAVSLGCSSMFFSVSGLSRCRAILYVRLHLNGPHGITCTEWHGPISRCFLEWVAPARLLRCLPAAILELSIVILLLP